MKLLVLTTVACAVAIITTVNLFIEKSSFSDLEMKLKRTEENSLLNVNLVALAGKIVPFTEFKRGMNQEGSNSSKDYAGSVVVVFNSTVCGPCLRQQLALMKAYKDTLEKKKLNLVAIVGARSEGERSDVLQMEKNGELFFPYAMWDPEKINKEFIFDSDLRYRETPLYLLTDSRSQILSAFSADSDGPRLLISWLQSISL